MSIQNVKFDSQDPHSFTALAARAVELERAGLWQEAVLMWNNARQVARKAKNEAWARDRADYCLTAKHRNWRTAA